MDRVATITDARSGMTSYTYIKRGEVAPKTDAEGYVISYEYDGNGNSGNQNNGNNDKPTGSDVKKTSAVVKQFVVDFSHEDFESLMEHEVNGLDYRYVNSNKAQGPQCYIKLYQCKMQFFDKSVQ